jgi:hypothetical protein
MPKTVCGPLLNLLCQTVAAFLGPANTAFDSLAELALLFDPTVSVTMLYE